MRISDDPLTLALIEYIGKAQDILGQDTEIRPCAYCLGLGFNPIERQQDSHSHVCEDCAGWGEVITGSKVQGNEARMCPTCKGSGYIAEQVEIVLPGAADGVQPPHILSEEEVAQIVRDAQEKTGQHAA